MNIYISWLCTAIVSVVFIGMSFGYTQKRAGRKYAEGRTPAPSIRSFKFLSKVLFLFSMMLTLLSYWISSPLLWRLYESSWLQILGALLVLIGYVLLRSVLKVLGSNYSPLFDAFLPKQIITTGHYQNIRHPIYLYNLFVSFGLALSSGLLWVLISTLIGFTFVMRAISIEEKYLQSHFPAYTSYMNKSWKILPCIY